jgi:putative transcriptional regulator
MVISATKCNIYIAFLQYICYILYMVLIFKENLMKNQVKKYRVDKHLTQSELALLVGVTRQTISLIESGKYNPSLNLCIAIAKALNKTLDDLFWEVS